MSPDAKRLARGRAASRESSRRGEWVYRSAVVALTGLFGCGSLIWALTTPAFHGPDETFHVNSVARLIDGEGWPLPYDARVKGSTWQAVEESGRGIRVDVPPGHDSTVPSPDQRAQLTEPTDLPDGGRDQMVQHPPGYYGIAAATANTVGGGSAAWDTALVAMRMTSVALTAAAVPFIVGVGRRASGSRRAGVVGAASLLGIPFFLTMGGYVTNDSALLLGVSATLYAAVRAIDSARSTRWLAATGGLLGLTLLMKGLALLLIPVVGGLTVMALWRRSRPTSWVSGLALLALPQAVAFVVGGWWWLRNLVLLGSVQPSQCAGEGGCSSIAPDNPAPRDFGVFATEFGDRFVRLFWGRGGLEEIAYPRIIVVLASVVLLAIVLASIAVGRRRGLLVMLLVFPALIVATLFYNAYRIYVDIGVSDRGVQGRYVFCGAAAIAAAVAALASRFRLSGLATRAGSVAWVLAMSAVAVAGWVWVFERLWVEPAGTWRAGLFRASDAVGVSPYATSAVIALAAAFLVALVGLLSLPTRRSAPSSSADPAMEGSAPNPKDARSAHRSESSVDDGSR